MKLNLQTVISTLIRNAAESIRSVPPPDDTKPTSIRLNPKTRQFIQTQAAALHSSVNAVIETILDGVAETTISPVSAQFRMMGDRFMQVLEAHGLTMPQILSVLTPYGFTASALTNSERFHDLLTLPTLRSIADRFAVKIEWLSGTDDRPTAEKTQWYKGLPGAMKRLTQFTLIDVSPTVMFVTRENPNFTEARAKDDAGEELPIGIVVHLEHRNPDGFYYSTYEKWQFERWNYWRCRLQLKALALACEKKGIPTYGYTLKQSELDALRSDRILPVTILARKQPTWHPQDYTTDNANIGKDVDELPRVIECYNEEFGS